MKYIIIACAVACSLFTSSASAHIFREPNRVCNILSAEGFILAEPWRKDAWQDFSCATAYYPLSQTTSVPTNISYYVESEVEDEAIYMYLVLNINDDGYREQGKAKYVKTIAALFKGLEISLPEELVATVQSETPKVFDEEYGVVTFETIRGATDTLRLTLRNRRG